MPIDQPPAIIQVQDQTTYASGKKFYVKYHYGTSSGSGRGWWAHIEGHASPFGAWNMTRGPYPFRWMAELEFPIERLTKDGPRR